jgi:hypothetical protein
MRVCAYPAKYSFGGGGGRMFPDQKLLREM